MRLANSIFSKPLLSLAIAGLFSIPAAEAALVVPASNNLVVNDTDLIVTWTRDANLFNTMATASGNAATFVTTIINSVGGTVYDTPNDLEHPIYSGYKTLASGDFNTSNGMMTWWGAKAWVGYLNSISYAGLTGWRLPTADTCGGYNCASSELGHLYYTELNKVAYPAANFGILGTGTFSDTSGSVGPFSNAHTNMYWSGTEYAAPNAVGAWGFGTFSGGQGIYEKNRQFYVWAVRPGQVASVPVPGAVWLMGSALVGLFGLGRRKAATSAIG